MTERISDEKLLKLIPKEELDKALEFWKEFHWGYDPKKLYPITPYKFPKAVTMLGWLRGLIYQTSKKGDGKDVWYCHSTSPNPQAKDGLIFPALACDPKGKQLIIVGGNYRIEDRGIVG